MACVWYAATHADAMCSVQCLLLLRHSCLACVTFGAGSSLDRAAAQARHNARQTIVTVDNRA